MTTHRNDDGTCGCTAPNPSHRDGKSEWCTQCGGRIDPRWAISLQNTRDFLRRLETAFPAPPDYFEQFEADVLARQKKGERTFGQRGLGKDMQVEGNEEAVDMAVYAVIGLLQERRAGTDENIEVALEIAACAAKAYALNHMWKGKHRGRAHAARAHDEEE